MSENKGEFKERLLEYNNSNGDLGVSEGLHFAIKVLDEARKEFPLKPIVEAINIYKNLVNHTNEEKTILIKEHLNNCNLEQFVTEAIDWFLKWFGENKK